MSMWFVCFLLLMTLISKYVCLWGKCSGAFSFDVIGKNGSVPLRIFNCKGAFEPKWNSYQDMVVVSLIMSQLICCISSHSISNTKGKFVCDICQNVARSILCPTGASLCLLVPKAAYEITIMRININYKLFGQWLRPLTG